MKVPLAVFLMVSLWSPESYAAKTGWRRLDGGPALSAGIELAITYVRMTGREVFDGRERISADATMVSLMTIYQADYDFTRYLGLGLRGGVGRILNSDGFSLQAIAGPTLTIYLGQLVYLGVDAWLQMLRFENVSDLDADFTLGFSFGARLGLVFEIKNVFTVVPEIRFGAQPVTVVFDDAFYTFEDGGRIVAADRMITVGGGAGVSARFFF